jgi:general secretion pathway protein D
MQIRKDLVRVRELYGNRLVSVGNAERSAERFDHAEEAYAQALRVDPGNGRARTGLERVAMDRRHEAAMAEAQTLFNNADAAGATARLKEVFLENPNHGNALALQRQINERIAKERNLEPSLRANFQKPVTLQFRDANLRMVLESLSRATGINVLLDKDIRPDVKVTIFVKGTSVEDAVDLILMQSQLEKKVLSDNTIFIYPNVPAKTRDYQDLKVRSFHLVNAEAKQMQALIKTILKTKDLFIHEKTNSLIMRDTPNAIRLAEKIIADQDIAEPEAMLELEVLEITHTRLSELGIQYPDKLTLQAPSAATGLTLGALRNLKSGSLLVTTIPSITFNAHLDDSNVNVLASPRIRARNKEKAKIHIGDRLPVFTNSVTPLATGASVTTGTVQYLEVGLKLEVEPDIHSDGEVGIKISMEVSQAGIPETNPVSGTTAYPISTRTASTVLRLKDGETQVLAGLIGSNETNKRVMIPGLGEIPVLGRLFSSHKNDGSKTEIVLSITPRIVGRTRLQQAQSVEFWSGTESTLQSAPLTLYQTGTVAVSASTGVQPADRIVPQPPRLAPPPMPPIDQPEAPVDLPTPITANP